MQSKTETTIIHSGIVIGADETLVNETKLLL